MTQETKNCQSCKNPFTIEPEDFLFYDKIHVPPPTFCPLCRKQRRLSWRNDMNLFSRTCDLCKKSIISIYSTNKPFPVYCQKCWWSDAWDQKQYAQPYDFSRNFFAQFKELQNKVPVLATVNDDGIASVNSQYTQDFAFSKNCYMVFIAWKLEDCLYSYYLVNGKDIVDSVSTMGECERIYDTIYTKKCYNCRNVYQSESLLNCSFCYDCRGCSDCFMSVGLRQKQYYFQNRPYPKDEYQKILAEYRLNTWSGMSRAKREFAPMLLRYPHKYSHMRNCFNCTGDNLLNGKNSKHCFNVQRPEDCKWVENSDTPKDSYDLSVGGELNQCYESITPDHSYQSLFAIFSWKNTNVAYVDACHSSKDLFGCCGLKKAQYCILNKQYTKEEYEALLPKIKKQMEEMPYVDKQGNAYSFGEFFPTALSPFGYNESVAQESFTLSQDEAMKRGFSWQEKFQLTTGKETLKAALVPDSIRDVADTITDEILACKDCQRNYRIVPQELQFYRKCDIPIPRQCFYCRHRSRLLLRNPYRLWPRSCGCAGSGSQNGTYHNAASHLHGTSPCPNEFETSYDLDRPEIVYCESCYNAEVV